MERIRRSAAALVLFTLAATACGDSSTDPPPRDAGEVLVDDNVFRPQTTNVGSGQVVTWTWEGNNPHNVTWDQADLPGSSTMSTGSHQVTAPPEPGSYTYHCTIHGAPGSGMHGTMVVE